MGSSSEYNLEPAQGPERPVSKLIDAAGYKPAPAETTAPAGHARVIDLLAFLGVLILAGGITLLVDRAGQLPGRLAFAGAVGLVIGCMTAWRRLRRAGPRR